MAKRCPPGVICIENMTIFMIIVSLLVVLYLVNTYNMNLLARTQQGISSQNFYNVPSAHGLSYSHPQESQIKYMPVNQRTQPTGDTSYRQIGILSRKSGDPEVIMPLYGMNVHTGRDKWQYYTVTEHNVRLPISLGGKSCTSEYGCDSVNNGDVVYVEGYNDAFTVTIYDDVGKMRYIPYL